MSGWGTIYDNMVSALQIHSQSLVRLQEQVASGSRILRASDAPSDAFRVMHLQEDSQSLEIYSKNIDRVTANIGTSSTILEEFSRTLIHLGGLFTQAASGTYTDEQRAGIAAEIDSILDQAVSFANTKRLGQYLFGGDSTTTPPYVAQRTDGHITAVDYQGSFNNLVVPVGPGVKQSATQIGEEVFRNSQRQQPEFLGNTGAGVGAGTSSVRGDVWLTITHDTTTYAGATGVAAGSRSASEDTIIGTSHTLTIDADNSRIQLDGGSFVAYGVGGDDGNIEVTNASGDVIYVDVTGLDPGLSGTVDVSITATGKLSIDGLASTVDLDAFTNNEVVTDSQTGRALYVDATAITRTGVEPVRVPGTYDIFGMLIGMRDRLPELGDLSPEARQDMLQDMSDSLTEVMGGVVKSLASTGGQWLAMETLKTSMEGVKAGLDEQRSGLQDADVIQLAIDLMRTQTLYEMILNSTAKVLSLSLMDFI